MSKTNKDSKMAVVKMGTIEIGHVSEIHGSLIVMIDYSKVPKLSEVELGLPSRVKARENMGAMLREALSQNGNIIPESGISRFYGLNTVYIMRC